MKCIIYFLSFMVAVVLMAQEVKNEKESKLKEEDVANELRRILSPYLIDAKKVRLYEETDGDHKSYEAKFELYKAAYSIEFSESFILEDIEIVIEPDDIEKKTFEKIANYLNGGGKYKITKIQKQFTNQQWSVEQSLKKGIEEGVGEILRYEVEAMIKMEDRWMAVEVLFSAEGDFIQQREIIKRNADYILY